MRNHLERALERQASRVLSERGVGLKPDPWEIVRDDMLGPRELDVSSSSALRQLEGMRGLDAIKSEVRVVMH